MEWLVSLEGFNDTFNTKRLYSHEQKKVYTRIFYVIQYISNIFRNGFLHIKLDKIYNKVIPFVSS